MAFEVVQVFNEEPAATIGAEAGIVRVPPNSEVFVPGALVSIFVQNLAQFTYIWVSCFLYIRIVVMPPENNIKW